MRDTRFFAQLNAHTFAFCLVQTGFKFSRHAFVNWACLRALARPHFVLIFMYQSLSLVGRSSSDHQPEPQAGYFV